SVLMAAIFFFMITLPLVLTSFLGAGELEYGEKEYERPEFSMKTFFDGKFQTNFELWFSRSYYLRKDFVQLYNRLDAAKYNILLYRVKAPDEVNTVNDKKDDTKKPAETNEEPPEKIVEVIIEPKFWQYAVDRDTPVETPTNRGSEAVIIGKSGYLFEAAYIWEYYGFWAGYVDKTDDQLLERVRVLKEIQDAAYKMGKGFVVVITPSKASHYTEYIPEWFKAQYVTLRRDYVRPYIRFKKFLQDYGVNFVDSQDVHNAVGMTNTFTKTGIHWNMMSSFEVVDAIVTDYERQLGIAVRHMEIYDIEMVKQGRFSDRDVFDILYSGRSRENAVVDDWYYYPLLRINPETGTNPAIQTVYLQGGSFTGNIHHFLDQGFARKVRTFYYNNGGNVNVDWSAYVDDVDLLILETNEQFVYDMGGGGDMNPATNIVDALHRYVTGNWK
ncbi:MAG: hypothetical protein FWD23_18260, partial [Oscillospiraceae bacterium]|nr:hypothetical protein [Oscillospiraceae bacterium]